MPIPIYANIAQTFLHLTKRSTFVHFYFLVVIHLKTLYKNNALTGLTKMEL